MKYSPFGRRQHRLLKKEDKNLPEISDDILDKLSEGQLTKQFNQLCKLDVSDIILPKLEYFIINVCPEIYNYFIEFIKFYEKEKIDFVITVHRTSPIEFSAIAAANYCKNVKSTGIQHGNEVFLQKYWYNSEMKSYDLYICTDKEIKNHFNQICKSKGYSTVVKCSSHKFSNIQKIKHIRSMQKNDSDKKNRIIYLPTMFEWDCRRMESHHYSDTWYYKFQKTLLQYFSQKKDYMFVWKGLPSSDAIYNPIPDYIKDKKFNNIEIAVNPFIQHLSTADRVICDYPCTGFYESIVADVPTVSVYPRYFRLRESALKHFSHSLKPFSKISEAIDKIDDFLSSDPETYKSTIEMDDKSIVKILEEISSSKKT